MPRIFIDRPEYSTRVRLPKFNIQPTAVGPLGYQDAAKVLTKTCVGWTRADHIRRSRVLMRLVDLLESKWSRLRREYVAQFGEPPVWQDYARDPRLTRDQRTAFWDCAAALGHARDLATAHDYVVSRLSRRLAS